jgi:hypothetical protein
MTNFVYDPKRQGYDTELWKTLSGTPSVSSDEIILNNASIVHYGDIYGCTVTFRLIIPAIPTLGDYRQFGLASVGFGSSILFDITDNIFSIKTNDGKGNSVSSAITFDPAWAGTSVDFKIHWSAGMADFFVNNVAMIPHRISDISVSSGPMSLYLNNTNADNMAIVSINVQDIQTFI